MNNLELLKSNGVNVDQAIELLGDVDMYNDVLSDFLDEAVGRLSDMEGLKNSSDMANYAILAHSMKSDSKYLGFSKLAEISLAHELKGKENDAQFVIDNFEELKQETNRILNVVREYLGK